MSIRVGVAFRTRRSEEKLLFAAMKKHPRIEPVELYEPRISLPLTREQQNVDIVLERLVSHTRALDVLAAYEYARIPCINSHSVASVCGNKLTTSLALSTHEVAQPNYRAFFLDRANGTRDPASGLDAALEMLDEFGYPLVLKPILGSWGRGVQRIDNPVMARSALIEKRQAAELHNGTVYVQEYINKNTHSNAERHRDIRSFVIGDECIAAIYRTSEDWLTNTARGAKASNCPLDDALVDISLAAARAVGGGVLAVDLFDDPDRGYLVGEVNYTMEFRNSIDTTGVDIPARIVDYIARCS